MDPRAVQVIQQLLQGIHTASPGVHTAGQISQQAVTQLLSGVLGQQGMGMLAPFVGSLAGKILSPQQSTFGNSMYRPKYATAYVNNGNMSYGGFSRSAGIRQMKHQLAMQGKQIAKGAIRANTTGSQNGGITKILRQLGAGDYNQQMIGSNIGSVGIAYMQQQRRKQQYSGKTGQGYAADKRTARMLQQGLGVVIGNHVSGRQSYGGLGANQVSQLAAYMGKQAFAGTQKIFTDQKAKGSGNQRDKIRSLASAVGKNLRQMAQSLQPLKDVFGKNIPDMINGLQQFTGVAAKTMSKQQLRAASNTLRTVSQTTNVSMQQLSGYTQTAKAGAVGMTGRLTAHNMGTQLGAQMAYSTNNDNAMVDKRTAQALQQKRIMQGATSKQANFYNLAFGQFMHKQQNKNKYGDMDIQQQLKAFQAQVQKYKAKGMDWRGSVMAASGKKQQRQLVAHNGAYAAQAVNAGGRAYQAGIIDRNLGRQLQKNGIADKGTRNKVIKAMRDDQVIQLANAGKLDQAVQLAAKKAGGLTTKQKQSLSRLYSSNEGQKMQVALGGQRQRKRSQRIAQQMRAQQKLWNNAGLSATAGDLQQQVFSAISGISDQGKSKGWSDDAIKEKKQQKLTAVNAALGEKYGGLLTADGQGRLQYTDQDMQKRMSLFSPKTAFKMLQSASQDKQFMQFAKTANNTKASAKQRQQARKNMQKIVLGKFDTQKGITEAQRQALEKNKSVIGTQQLNMHTDNTMLAQSLQSVYDKKLGKVDKKNAANPQNAKKYLQAKMGKQMSSADANTQYQKLSDDQQRFLQWYETAQDKGLTGQQRAALTSNNDKKSWEKLRRNYNMQKQKHGSKFLQHQTKIRQQMSGMAVWAGMTHDQRLAAAGGNNQLIGQINKFTKWRSQLKKQDLINQQTGLAYTTQQLANKWAQSVDGENGMAQWEKSLSDDQKKTYKTQQEKTAAYQKYKKDSGSQGRGIVKNKEGKVTNVSDSFVALLTSKNKQGALAQMQARTQTQIASDINALRMRFCN